MPYMDPSRRLARNPALRGWRLPSLTYWRMRRGLELAQLAERANVRPQTIEAHERHGAVAAYKTIHKLAAALDVAPQVLTLPAPPPRPSMPPTVKPPTVKPPTVKPPTVKPPTVKPPTVKPPTVKPPTVKPPAPSPYVQGDVAYDIERQRWVWVGPTPEPPRVHDRLPDHLQRDHHAQPEQDVSADGKIISFAAARHRRAARLAALALAALAAQHRPTPW